VGLKFLYGFLKVSFALSLGLLVFTFFLLFRNTMLSHWPDKTSPAFYRLAYEEIGFTTRDGVKLRGWLLGKGSRLPTVILCHGLGTNKSDLISLANSIYEAGFNVFLFDFRGHGESRNRITSFGYLEQRDLEGAIEYIFKRQDLENKNLGVFGLSMGGAVAVMMAARDPRIKAVVSDSTYQDLYSSMVHHAKVFYSLPKFPFNIFLRLAYILRFGYDPKKISPQEAISQISPRPILIINGEKDKQVPAENAYALFNKANTPKELWVVPQAGHGEGYYRHFEQYQSRIIEFFQKNL